MKNIKNELTWSFSRDRLFHDCRRAYFYHYYASWGGWKADAGTFTHKAYILKNIRSIDVWIGDIVHQVIKWILENKIAGKNIPFEEARDKTKQLLLRTWEQSRSKMWKSNVKYNLNLFEHYYNCEPTREALASKLEKVVKSIRNIYRLGLVDFFSRLPAKSFLRIDELDSFNIQELKVFAVPDFAVAVDDEYTLYDWKTGKPSDKDVFQLSCYVLYAMHKWPAAADKVKIVPVYLSQEDISPSVITAVDIAEVKNYILASAGEMRFILSDIEENKADIDRCPKTNDIWRCANCKFKEVCTDDA